MARDNYHAWQVREEGFPTDATLKEQIEFLVGYAILAPSSHNSQPWKILINDNYLTVSLEKHRLLSESDTNDREAFISLGCFVQTFSIAADHFDYAVSTLIRDDGTIILTLQKGKCALPVSLFAAITKRVTNRNPYEKELGVEEFQKILSVTLVGETRISTISDRVAKTKAAAIAVEAGVEAMDMQGFRKELSQYVKWNFTSSPIGMPCFGMGLPTPISLIVPTLLRFVNMSRVESRKDLELLTEGTPMLCLLSTPHDTFREWIAVGRTYANIALEATSLGLSTAMWAAPVQIGEHHKELSLAFGTTQRSQSFFRIGKPTKETLHSPRLSVEKILSGGL